MGKTTIEWANFTFNPWLGCQKVSPACDHCYAETLVSGRMQSPQLWKGERRLTVDAYWQQPPRWNKQAIKDGVRPRVFCASLADVFDNQVPTEWRTRLWNLIRETTQLDWLLLTKRPQNIRKMLPEGWGPKGWPNVWLGTTVENQQEAERRIPPLLDVPARIHFLSCEPLLGPVDLRTVCLDWGRPDDEATEFAHVLIGDRYLVDDHGNAPSIGTINTIDWVICGGESGSKARPMHPNWARDLRNQCDAAGVPFLFKQWGEFLPGVHGEHWTTVANDGQLLVNDPRLHVERVTRVGKACAGRLLDGIEHNGVPT